MVKFTALTLQSCWPEHELYFIKNIRTAVQYGCQMNLWISYKMKFISSFPAASPQESFVLPMLSSNETRRGKPDQRGEESTLVQITCFSVTVYGFLASICSVSVYFLDYLFFPLPLFFDKRLWDKFCLCLVHQLMKLRHSSTDVLMLDLNLLLLSSSNFSFLHQLMYFSLFCKQNRWDRNRFGSQSVQL